MRIYLSLLFFTVCFLTTVSGQGVTETDIQLAEFYYSNNEYEKALLYFEDIYEKQPTQTNYEKYLICLKETDDFKSAEKLVKKQMKRYKNKLELHLDLAEVYEETGRPEEAQQEIEEAISSVGESRGQVLNLANALVKKNNLEMALRVYTKGKEKLNDDYFDIQIASLYGTMGDYERMIDSYLSYLAFKPEYLQSIQSSLHRSFDFQNDEKNVDLLKTQLLKNVQKHPEQSVYYEMLIWLFTQQKDFNAAFIQAKAIDKRQNEDGSRLIKLADLCANNEDFDVAAKCYEYVAEKGTDSRYFTIAKIMAVSTKKKALTYKLSFQEGELEALETNYENVLDELGRTAETSKLVRELAEIQAFYLHDPEKAIDLLDQAISIPGIDETFKAWCKLDLGDILLTQGYIWDASLYYSQVEKDFKEDLIGHEARFRNARVSYYVGEFEWAQAQLDILKASTSKLISNDAMDLSLLITDNLNLDTIYDPMLKFAKADLLTFQNKFDEALLTLDSINTMYPGHALSDEILYQRFRIAYKKRAFEEAASYLQEILDLYFYDILADNALFELAQMNERIFNKPEVAMEQYQRLLMEYPGSLFVVESRKRFRFLRGDEIN